MTEPHVCAYCDGSGKRTITCCKDDPNCGYNGIIEDCDVCSGDGKCHGCDECEAKP